jgi:molecular chaperone GrpE
LPTFDNLERAAGHAQASPDVKALAEGLNMVIRQFQDTLASLGIERVVSVGKPFDPAEHEAVQHVHSDEVPPGAVVQELQGGYRWQGRLMRPALVVVSKAPAPAAAAPESV